MPRIQVIVFTSIAAAAVCVLLIGVDRIRQGEQRMWIMNIVRPVTGLYAGPLGLGHIGLRQVATGKAVLGYDLDGHNTLRRLLRWETSLLNGRSTWFHLRCSEAEFWRPGRSITSGVMHWEFYSVPHNRADVKSAFTEKASGVHKSRQLVVDRLAGLDARLDGARNVCDFRP
jgi:hypothetical protein